MKRIIAAGTTAALLLSLITTPRPVHAMSRWCPATEALTASQTWLIVPIFPHQAVHAHHLLHASLMPHVSSHGHFLVSLFLVLAGVPVMLAVRAPKPPPGDQATRDEWWAQWLAENNPHIQERKTRFKTLENAHKWIRQKLRANGYYDTVAFRDQTMAVVLRALQIAKKLRADWPTNLRLDRLAKWAIEQFPGREWHSQSEVTERLRALELTIDPTSVSRVLKALAEKGEIEGGRESGRMPLYRKKNVGDEEIADATHPVEWRGIPAAQLPFEQTFWRHGEIDILTYIFGARPTDDAYGPAAENTVHDLLDVYALLRAAENFAAPSRSWEVAALLERVRERFPMERIQTADQLHRGLEWLELQGFPIRQWRRYERGRTQRYWMVNGLFRKHFASLDVSGWHRDLQTRWQRLDAEPRLYAVDEMPANLRDRIANRLVALFYLMRVTIKTAAHAQSRINILRSGKSLAALDRVIEAWATRLGIEAARIRWGVSRYVARQLILQRLPHIAIGARIRLLRQLAGLSVTSLAAVLGIPLSTLTAWENEYNVPSTPEAIDALSAVLDADRVWFEQPHVPDYETRYHRQRRLALTGA